MAIRKGSAVRSIKVGARKSFVGKVIAVVVGLDFGPRPTKSRWYMVADKDGALWHRTARELKPHNLKG